MTEWWNQYWTRLSQNIVKCQCLADQLFASASANNWSARHGQITIFCSTSANNCLALALHANEVKIVKTVVLCQCFIKRFPFLLWIRKNTIVNNTYSLVLWGRPLRLVTGWEQQIDDIFFNYCTDHVVEASWYTLIQPIVLLVICGRRFGLVPHCCSWTQMG